MEKAIQLQSQEEEKLLLGRFDRVIRSLRDLFGAHTYRRVDRDGVFHTRWSSDRVEEPAD